MNCLLPQQREELPLGEEGLKRLQKSAEKVDLFRLEKMTSVEDLFEYLL